MWWVRAGTIPEPSDAVARLECLERVGPSEYAFTFQSSFDAPAARHIALADLRQRSRPSCGPDGDVVFSASPSRAGRDRFGAWSKILNAGISRCSPVIRDSTDGSTPPSPRRTSTVDRVVRRRRPCARTCASTRPPPPRSWPAFARASVAVPTPRPGRPNGTRAPTWPRARCGSSPTVSSTARASMASPSDWATACVNWSGSSRTRLAPVRSPSPEPQRAQTARILIETTALAMTDVAFAAGFSSVRQFNDTVQAVYASSPTGLRARAKRPSPRRRGVHRHRAATGLSTASLSRQPLRSSGGHRRPRRGRGTGTDVSSDASTHPRPGHRRTHADARVRQAVAPC